ncbi:MAG: hypothetical protein D6739_07960, partial [Nitrospirae bacterium]
MARPGASFTVLYTSLSVILLALFVLLNSFAVPNRERRQRALGSLGHAFGLFEGRPTALAPEGGVEAPVIDLGGGDAGDLAAATARFSRRVAALEGGEGVEVQRGHDDWRLRLEGALLF